MRDCQPEEGKTIKEARTTCNKEPNHKPRNIKETSPKDRTNKEEDLDYNNYREGMIVLREEPSRRLKL